VEHGRILEEILKRERGSHFIVLADDDSEFVRLVNEKGLLSEGYLGEDEHLIKSVVYGRSEARFTLCMGREDIDVLYCAYSMIESYFGVKFRIRGDIISEKVFEHRLIKDDPIEIRLAPVFDKRGIQPFHDFPEGPDWWNINEYKFHLSQMTKMKMNFIGLHTYPLLEPAVWVGTKNDYQPNGDVTKSYPTRWITSLEGGWGYLPKITSQYLFGNSLMFSSDCYGADVMSGVCPVPTTNDEANQLFNRVGRMFNDTFNYAHRFGIETCVGTETPLSIPPGGSGSVQDYYEGIFGRIKQTYPIDYYWLWTPEDWEWSNVNISNPVVKQVVADCTAAQQALVNVGATFNLATCGWVVGPGGDRTYWDTVLPSNWVISSIDMDVGNTPVDPAYALIKNHKKWVIPWMEDDPDYP
jgi:hypothetical protein